MSIDSLLGAAERFLPLQSAVQQYRERIPRMAARWVLDPDFAFWEESAAFVKWYLQDNPLAVEGWKRSHRLDGTVKDGWLETELLMLGTDALVGYAVLSGALDVGIDGRKRIEFPLDEKAYGLLHAPRARIDHVDDDALHPIVKNLFYLEGKRKKVANDRGFLEEVGLSPLVKRYPGPADLFNHVATYPGLDFGEYKPQFTASMFGERA